MILPYLRVTRSLATLADGTFSVEQHKQQQFIEMYKYISLAVVSSIQILAAHPVLHFQYFHFI